MANFDPIIEGVQDSVDILMEFIIQLLPYAILVGIMVMVVVALKFKKRG